MPKQLTEEALNKEFTIKFNRKELTAIFNIIVSNQWKLGDARLLIPIIDKIEGPVVALTDKDFIQEDKPQEPLEVN